MSDKVDFEEFFKEWGESEVAVNQVFEDGLIGISGISLEEVYQAFEARILAKLQAQKVKDWGFDK